MFRIVAAACALALFCTSTASAQIRFGEFGFTATTAATSVGDACWGFSCRTHRIGVPGGTTGAVRFTVRAPLGAPYAILASPSATSCARIPGLGNALVLDAPFVVAVLDTIDIRNTARFCYDGLTEIVVDTPRLPPGTPIAVQAIAAIGTRVAPSTGPAFSSAIELIIR